MSVDTKELFLRLNQGVRDERLRIYERNIGMNRPLIDKYGGLSLFVSKLINKHVVAVGAGSSLDNNVHVLNILSSAGAVIIAADMAWKPLIKQNIVPAYVISCESTPRDFFSGTDTSRSTLLCFSAACPRIPREWKGDIHFYNWMIHSTEYDALWEKAGTHLGFAATGSTVSTQGISIALGCQIASLALAGNDLGFKDQFYGKGSVKRCDNENIVSRIQPLDSIEMKSCRTARDYLIPRDNRVYYTNHQFLAAKKWLEELFGKRNIIVYDSSVPGCTGKTIEKIPLSVYAERVVGIKRGNNDSITPN